METVTHSHGRGHGGPDRTHGPAADGHVHAPGEATVDTSTHAASASVALDIGDGRGALVIYPDERFRGHEIEISRVDGDGRRVHTGVHERSTVEGSTLTAIFGSLPAGEYFIWGGGQIPATSVTVADGVVAEIRLY
jgi:hypothetical protein